MNHTTGAAGQEGAGGHPPRGMIWILGQLFLVPISMFVHGLELLLRTAHDARRTAERGVEVMAGPQPQQPGLVPEPAPCPCRTAEETVWNEVIETAKDKEKHSMQDHDGGMRRDRDLHDDMLKLVRYKILFVRREYEHAFPEQEDLVYDSMDGTAFAAWKVAEFIQHLAKLKTPVPDKWTKKGYPKSCHQQNGMLTGLDDEDKKYLRVYYEVLERYPREKFKYEEEQIDILRQIMNKMEDKSGSPMASGDCAPGGGTGGTTGVGSSGSGATDRGLGYTPR